MNARDHQATKQRLRFVTAASLFDGHDAAINIMRRILQDSGVEVIHLGHNRSVAEVVEAAIEEDVHGIAISSYQGGHMEYFKYAKDLLAEKGCGHVKVFGGGGGVIIPEEIEELQAYGIDRIFSPEDGRKLGLQGMIDAMMDVADVDLPHDTPLEGPFPPVDPDDHRLVGQLLSMTEREDFRESGLHASLLEQHAALPRSELAPVIGVTGTGGAGKSSLVDEIVLRFLQGSTDARVAVLSIDPSRRRTGGALLGDRIRMNSLPHPRAMMRSFATRSARGELSASVEDAVKACQVAGYDWVIVETSGIGQGDTEITGLSDLALYVMTPEYGAPSQLEKIDMLDFADVVAVNKVRPARGRGRPARRAQAAAAQPRGISPTVPDPEDARPSSAPIASRFNDTGVNAALRGADPEGSACGRTAPARRRAFLEDAAPGVACRTPTSRRRASIPAGSRAATWARSSARCARVLRVKAVERIQLGRTVQRGSKAPSQWSTRRTRLGGEVPPCRCAVSRIDPRARELPWVRTGCGS